MLRAVASNPGIASLTTYEVGTFTPTVRGSSVAGANTYTTQVGTYVRIGALVYVQGYIVMSAKDGAMAGNIRLGGLPFATANIANTFGAIAVGPYSNIDLGAGYTQLAIGTLPNTTAALDLYECGDNVATAAIVAADIANNTAIQFSGTYRAA
jgi:hypothetical protein